MFPPELLDLSVGALGMLVALAAIALAGKALDARRKRNSDRPTSSEPPSSE